MIGFTSFCNEFVTDRRAGISNIKNTVQFYIIPPQLKGSISILRNMEGTDTNHTLYGIFVSKESGPEQYMKMNMNESTEMKETDMYMPDDIVLSPLHNPNDMINEMIINSGIEKQIIENKNLHLISSLPSPVTNKAIPIVSNVAPMTALNQSNPPINRLAMPMSMPNMPLNNMPATAMNINMIGNSNIRPGMIPRPMNMPALNMNMFPRPLISPPNFNMMNPNMNQSFAFNQQQTHIQQPKQLAQQQPQQHSQPQSQTQQLNYNQCDYHSQKQIINDTAKFCVDNGPQSIMLLKNKSDSFLTVPFIYENHKDYLEFQKILKSFLGMN